LQKYLWIALGGSLGALTRYWVGVTIASRLGTKFPYGTFVINITACVIIGFVLAFLGQHAELNPAWRFLIPIGFVGAYSTFSTFEWELFSSLETGGFLVAAVYLVSSIVLGLAAVWCGVFIARVIS
jgi:fluoride exporter